MVGPSGALALVSWTNGLAKDSRDYSGCLYPVARQTSSEKDLIKEAREPFEKIPRATAPALATGASST